MNLPLQMNVPDLLGILFIVAGVLLLIPTVYVGWAFVLGVGGLMSLGLFIVIEMGDAFRSQRVSGGAGDSSTGRLPSLNVRSEENLQV